MSIVLHEDRRAGKTTKLINELLKTSTSKTKLFVAPTHQIAKLTMKRAEEMLKETGQQFEVSQSKMSINHNGSTIEFVSFVRFMDPSFYKGREVKYVIDELEFCIQHYQNTYSRLLGVSVAKEL